MGKIRDMNMDSNHLMEGKGWLNKDKIELEVDFKIIVMLVVGINWNEINILFYNLLFIANWLL